MDIGHLRTLVARLAIVLGIAAVPVTASSAKPECSVPGEHIHWVADYCMLKLQTDDEIAASACIDEELKKSPRDACAAKAQLKRRMCEIRVRAGTRKGNVKECVEDPSFKGRTVTNGGVP